MKDLCLLSYKSNSWLFPRGEQNVNLPKVSPRNLPLMIQTQASTELQEVFSILVYCMVMVISVDMGESVVNNSLLLMYLLPCVSVKSGCSPVLAFRSQQMSTFPWAWKWLVSSLMWRACLRCSRGTLMAGCIWHTGMYHFWMRAVPCGF